MNASTLPLSISDIHQHIRAAGGIVHGDGNVFFTNAERFIAAAVLCGESPARASAATQAVDGMTAVHAGYARHKYAQGTKECIAFYRGACWAADSLREPPVALPALTDEQWLKDAQRLAMDHARAYKDIYINGYWQAAGRRMYDEARAALFAHLSNILAASAAPAPEQMQPNAQDKDHLALPLAGSVFGVNAAEALLTDAYAEGRKDEHEALLEQIESVMVRIGIGAADRAYMLGELK